MKLTKERMEDIIRDLVNITIEDSSELFYAIISLSQAMNREELCYFSGLTDNDIEEALREEEKTWA